MTPGPRWHLPPDMLARIARYKARKPRPVQRAEYRARMLERAHANYRQARGHSSPPAPPGAHDTGEPGAGGSPPNPPAGVS